MLQYTAIKAMIVATLPKGINLIGTDANMTANLMIDCSKRSIEYKEEVVTIFHKAAEGLLYAAEDINLPPRSTALVNVTTSDRNRTTPYHPQTKGPVKRIKGNIKVAS